MSAKAYTEIIRAPREDRLDLFLATASRLGTPVGNVEKDFWVCWTLDALYHRLPSDRPRLLFKGGTSLSKAYGLIQRFSEDIDVTVFRDDLDEPATVEEIEALSGRKRRAKLDAIRDACRAYVTGPLRDALAELVAEATAGEGRIEIDEADPDGQTLLVWYPEVEPRDDAYVRPAVRIESGAKSALDPNRPVAIRPYVADETVSLNLTVADVTTIEPSRTFWGQGRDRSRPHPMVRAPRSASTGRPADLPPLLRSSRARELERGPVCNVRPEPRGRLRPPRTHVLRPAGSGSRVGKARNLRCRTVRRHDRRPAAGLWEHCADDLRRAAFV